MTVVKVQWLEMDDTNIQHIYASLMEHLDKIENTISIYKKGIVDELEELSKVEFIRSEIYEAIHVSSKTAPIISLKEFAKAKQDYADLGKMMDNKRLAINKIEEILKDKQKEIELLTKKINDLQKKLNGADVLIFSSDKKRTTDDVG